MSSSSSLSITSSTISSPISSFAEVKVPVVPHNLCDIKNIFSKATITSSSENQPPKTASVFDAKFIIDYYATRNIAISLTEPQKEILTEVLRDLPYSYFPTLPYMLGIYFYRLLKTHGQNESARMLAFSFGSVYLNHFHCEYTSPGIGKEFTANTHRSFTGTLTSIIKTLPKGLPPDAKKKILLLTSLCQTLLAHPEIAFILMDSLNNLSLLRITTIKQKTLGRAPDTGLLCLPVAKYQTSLQTYQNLQTPLASLEIVISMLQFNIDFTSLAGSSSSSLAPLIHKSHAALLLNLNNILVKSRTNLSNQEESLSYLQKEMKAKNNKLKNVTIPQKRSEKQSLEIIDTLSSCRYFELIILNIESLIINKVSGLSVELNRVRLFANLDNFIQYRNYSFLSPIRLECLLDRDFKRLFEQLFYRPNQDFIDRYTSRNSGDNFLASVIQLVETTTLFFDPKLAFHALLKLYKKYSYLATQLHAASRHAKLETLKTSYLTHCCWLFPLLQLAADSKSIRKKKT